MGNTEQDYLFFMENEFEKYIFFISEYYNGDIEILNDLAKNFDKMISHTTDQLELEDNEFTEFKKSEHFYEKFNKYKQDTILRKREIEIGKII